MSDLVADVPELFLTRNERDVIAPLLGRELKPEGYDRAEVALASLDNFIYLIRASAAQSETAMSWRDYRVGAAVLAYNFKNPAIGVLTGSNIKPTPYSILNFHAEQIALAKVRRYGLNEVFALAVWGDPDDMDANPAQTPTLRPCRRCDGMLETASEVTDRTLILSGNQDFSQCELYSAAELHTYYKDSEANGPVSDAPVYSLAEDANEDDYILNVFTPYLLPKISKLYPDSKLARFAT